MNRLQGFVSLLAFAGTGFGIDVDVDVNVDVEVQYVTVTTYLPFEHLQYAPTADHCHCIVESGSEIQTPIETFISKPDSWQSVVVPDANRGGWSSGGQDTKGKTKNKGSSAEDCDEPDSTTQWKIWDSVSIHEGKTWKVVNGTTTKVIKEITTVVNNKTLTATVTSTATITHSPKIFMKTTVRQVEVDKILTQTLLVNKTISSIVTAVPTTVTVHDTDTVAVLEVSTVHDNNTIAVVQMSTVRETDTVAVLDVSTVTPDFFDVVTAEAPTPTTAEAAPTPETDRCAAQPGDPAYALGPDGQLYATTVPHDPRHPPGPIITPGMLKASQECVPGSFRCINNPIGWEACTTEGDWTFAGTCPPDTHCRYYASTGGLVCVPGC